MCVIVFVPADKTVSEETLRRCFTANPDGWGIMYASGNEVLFQKDITGFSAFLEAWSKIPEGVHKTAHFRIKTHGDIKQRNCHPFLVETKHHRIGMMHNGVFQIPCLLPNMSDTWHLAKLISGTFQETVNFLEIPEVQDMFTKICSYNRLIFQMPNGDSFRFGSWHERDGCFFSNLNHEPVPKSTKYSYHKPQKDPYADWYKGYGNKYTSEADVCDLKCDVCSKTDAECTALWKSKATTDKLPIKTEGTEASFDKVPVADEEVFWFFKQLWYKEDYQEMIELMEEYELTVADLLAQGLDAAVAELLQHILDSYSLGESHDK